MYVDYEFYTNTYYDLLQEPKIPQEKRTFYLRKASIYLDSLILDKPIKPYDEKILLACCEVADFMYTKESREGISSENNDGYSVTYKGDDNSSKALYNIVFTYLGDTGLLYRGIG